MRLNALTPQKKIKVGKQSKSILAIIPKTPEEIVEERHMSGYIQKTIEASTKGKEKTKEVQRRIADFFYENGIPFNASKSRSYEIMVEAIGQYGPGLRPTSYHQLWEPFLEDFVNSRGAFFLESIDASAESHYARILADQIEKKVEEIGKEHAVKIVTDNGANYKAAGRLLEQHIPGLFWTPCAAHCIDLMLEDIGKMNEFKPYIQKVRDVTTFIYRHGRILSAMREKTGGRDLVRPATTRFATAFLTFQSLNKHRNELRQLFVENCLRATFHLLIVLRIVDGDEKPAMPELSLAMNHAKKKITESFTNNNKTRLLAKLMEIIEDRWSDQMEVKLYGVVLFLNSSKYFELKRSDRIFAHEELMDKISGQADDYDKIDLVHEDRDLEWHHVDEAIGALSNLNSSDLRSKGVGEFSGLPIVYDCCHGPSNRRLKNEDEENDEDDDMNSED
ncbi:uncharacterized protein LOC127262391 [Andrographis paniculata]|uniref:uncharacterized protein LOC127262391 n=1 Tax=Andrographis paniculata TaxID=175694 RepID=UPI0021E7331E|nr:uncharacterized protein LOC127262391 [Andrographis paniculata]